MKKLDKYLSLNFFKVLTGSLLFMTGLYIITIYIDDMKYFSNPDVPAFLIFKYILFRIPEIFIQILPAAALFSTSYLFGTLNSTNEIIAVYNGGIGFVRLITPLTIIGLLLTIFVFAFFELVSVDCSSRAFECKSMIKKMSGKDLNYMYSKSKFFYRGKDNVIYYTECFFADRAEMLYPVLFKFGNNGVMEYQLSAANAKYDYKNKLWNFTKAKKINLDKGEYKEENLDSYIIKLAETPANFMQNPRSISQMHLPEAISFIEEKKQSGLNYREQLVELYWRFSFPFSVLITILIGSIAGIYFRRAVLVLSFFLSLVLSFGYYGLLALGIAYGKSGRLSPMLAAWIGNIIYVSGVIIALRFKR